MASWRSSETGKCPAASFFIPPWLGRARVFYSAVTFPIDNCAFVRSLPVAAGKKKRCQLMPPVDERPALHIVSLLAQPFCFGRSLQPAKATPRGREGAPGALAVPLREAEGKGEKKRRGRPEGLGPARLP